MAHGATRKIRRHARHNWMDLRGLDKRQQRRAVRRSAARSRGRFLVANPKFDPLLMFAPSLDPSLDLRYLMAVAMPVVAHRGPLIIVADVS